MGCNSFHHILRNFTKHKEPNCWMMTRPSNTRTRLFGSASTVGSSTVFSMASNTLDLIVFDTFPSNVANDQGIGPNEYESSSSNVISRFQHITLLLPVDSLLNCLIRWDLVEFTLLSSNREMPCFKLLVNGQMRFW